MYLNVPHLPKFKCVSKPQHSQMSDKQDLDLNNSSLNQTLDLHLNQKILQTTPLLWSPVHKKAALMLTPNTINHKRSACINHYPADSYCTTLQDLIPFNQHNITRVQKMKITQMFSPPLRQYLPPHLLSILISTPTQTLNVLS